MAICRDYWGEAVEARDWDRVAAAVTADVVGTWRIDGFTEFWPEPYEPPAGREHLLERY